MVRNKRTVAYESRMIKTKINSVGKFKLKLSRELFVRTDNVVCFSGKDSIKNHRESSRSSETLEITRHRF